MYKHTQHCNYGEAPLVTVLETKSGISWKILRNNDNIAGEDVVAQTNGIRGDRIPPCFRRLCVFCSCRAARNKSQTELASLPSYLLSLLCPFFQIIDSNVPLSQGEGGEREMGYTMAGHTIFRRLSPEHSGSGTWAGPDSVLMHAALCTVENWIVMPILLSAVFCQWRRFLTKNTAERIHHPNQAPLFPLPGIGGSPTSFLRTSSVNQKWHKEKTRESGKRCFNTSFQYFLLLGSDGEMFHTKKQIKSI